MKLPNGDKAIVDDQKLFGYLLSTTHRDGRQHAKLFKDLLEIDASNAEVLRAALLEAARSGNLCPENRQFTAKSLRFDFP